MRIVVAPRWGGTPADDWYPWATGELERDGVSLEALEMPDPTEPEIDAWVAAVSAGLAGGVPAETVLVGHSVGCRAALGAVERLPDGVALRGLVLAAAWWDVDDPWPSILPWQALGHDATRIQAAAGRPLVLLSDNDPFTADWQRNSDEWVERLDADVRVYTGVKHFNASQEPAVLAAIRELL
jgi:predicted alpha/beta hydrolase family esterase